MPDSVITMSNEDGLGMLGCLASSHVMCKYFSESTKQKPVFLQNVMHKSSVRCTSQLDMQQKHLGAKAIKGAINIPGHVVYIIRTPSLQQPSTAVEIYDMESCLLTYRDILYGIGYIQIYKNCTIYYH
jgi:hypothetical protein